MQINWSTFVLEIINFLVLVWLLRHFLYQPVLNVLHQRRARVAEKLALAEQTESEAQQIKQQFQEQVAGWAQEQAEQRQALANELKAIQNEALAQQHQALSQARKRDSARQAHQQRQWQQNIELRALRQAGSFASQLLSELSCPQLEARLLELFISQWHQLPDSALAGPRAALGEGACLRVRSVDRLDSDQRQQLQQAIEQRLSGQPPGKLLFEFEQAPELLCGIELIIGSWHLGANLNDELRFFADAAQEVESGQEDAPHER